jgi:hypothetical protein
MQSQKYEVSYPAQVQVERLSPTEKRELPDMFADPDLEMTTKRSPHRATRYPELLRPSAWSGRGRITEGPSF